MREENGGKQMKSVWEFPCAYLKKKKLGKHPTQKHIVLVARCLRASTDPGDVVLDPFAGSGTTGIAAFRLPRRFIGFELVKDCALLAVRRLEDEMANSSTTPLYYLFIQYYGWCLVGIAMSMSRTDALFRLKILVGQDFRSIADQYGITVYRNGKLDKGWADTQNGSR